MIRRRLAATIAVGLMITAAAFAPWQWRGRVPADVLACSRGNSDASTLKQFPCDPQNSNAPCQLIGAACFTCSKANYVAALGSGGGGYNSGGGMPNNCGVLWYGTCNALLDCTGTFNTGIPCTAPVAPSVQ